ncbi:hypothetical protein [Roseivivax isoporae]|uniref:Antitoxin Xre/MbcA/ParS-like toxin-binding domain-containing protein n=1 Tax=Roseivivax isoporae LMG 25204 TaxID=1449351 RepID=X7FB72_9RHOB|nr:hypothetical protein [Roseivivax isoporae]ETX29366.1 hypothetical protein RISW2_01465 [Roseivivax isoporae LMG 25204]
MIQKTAEARARLNELVEARLGADEAGTFMSTPHALLGWQTPEEIAATGHLGLMKVTVLVTSLTSSGLAA